MTSIKHKKHKIETLEGSFTNLLQAKSIRATNKINK
jgi:hypothetical protein